ncbi:alpha-1,3-mannosyl-glycoprotein 4-beta-N-acetylglucosaminyltransferase A isoform X1 [Ornithorhynchus anatinus]|uniref:Alpha-1,3-mannosyl-glycoprotein 4-beta-N-acetylglucosaminyltransferase A n=1 Tax=Ornithorhynchus anatinus TaxID=9258 RepID=A0A6I8P825_ORNAN|nr:alpha-1,3-mannosyl-glycoprotein 4-beta-N-acetylglucosaminyltransferase A isoform X1 [Ornithorhynchus anatinus]XP_028935827.1 alpha-1,3-mannosyl-glycoprotein 4-beta-N-acetylglucosaminyltransferase A isoform X1 [Ornithorhynchus anatinus]
MRLRNGPVAAALVFVTSFLGLSWYTAWQNGKERLIAYQREFHALRERLRRAERRTLQRSSELNAVSEQFRRAVAEARGGNGALTGVSDATLKLLKELTSKRSLQVPNIYYHLPHLLKNEGSLQPGVQIGFGRTGVSIVMGIPTVKRKVRSYLTETLHSLIDKLSPEEKLDCIIVVYIGETDPDYVNSVVAVLEKEFSTEINSGLVEIISPPATYYPDLTNLKETFGDSKERVKWRTKQNLDYCFLMMYAQRRGIYYIQLEDDIVVKQNYFSTIKNFALQVSSEDWMILEFSQLGFIGKMFQAPDITLIVEFIFMFYKEKPIDWLLDHILWVKVCHPEKDAKHCDRQKANLRIRFRPSLFQHVGLHSSLPGKIQKLTDKDFLKPLLHKIHINPPAEVSSSLKVYQGHTLEKTYMGEDFFWAVTPVAGDYILFKFDKPVDVERYLFHSGHPDHPGDILVNTTVEVLPFKSEEMEIHPDAEERRLEDGYFRIGRFESGVARGTVHPSLNPVSALRLSVVQNAAMWAILSEIHIKKIPN